MKKFMTFCLALLLSLNLAIAQTPFLSVRTDPNNKLIVTAITPYVGYTSWYVVWAEVSGNIFVFTSNTWVPLEHCRVGIPLIKIMCGQGEERELKLFKSEVTCNELGDLGSIKIYYGMLDLNKLDLGQNRNHVDTINHIGELFRVSPNGNCTDLTR